MAYSYRKRYAAKPRRWSKKALRKVVKKTLSSNLEHKVCRIVFDDISNNTVQPAITWQIRSIPFLVAVQGVDNFTVIGRQFRITSIDFVVRFTPGVAGSGGIPQSASSTMGDFCRFLVVQDNDATPDATNNYTTRGIANLVMDTSVPFKVYTTTATASNVYDQRQVENKRRFVIKKEIVHTMTTTAVNSALAGAAGFQRYSTGEGMYRFRIPFKGGLLMQKSTGTAAVVSPADTFNANFIGKDLFVMYASNSSNCCTLQYRAYINYTDA